MSRHHDIGSRYEEPDFRDADMAKCYKCGELGDIETMHTKDCCDWMCNNCKKIVDAKRAELEECERFDHHDDDRSSI